VEYDREKQFELVDIHLAAPISAHCTDVRLPPDVCDLAFDIGEKSNAFYTAGKCLRQIPARRNSHELVKDQKAISKLKVAQATEYMSEAHVQGHVLVVYGG